MKDIIVIGGGPAGLSTALYAQRAGYSVIVIDKGATECQITKAVEVENYLGFPSISGIDLHEKFKQHITNNNIPINKVNNLFFIFSPLYSLRLLKPFYLI